MRRCLGGASDLEVEEVGWGVAEDDPRLVVIVNHQLDGEPVPVLLLQPGLAPLGHLQATTPEGLEVRWAVHWDTLVGAVPVRTHGAVPKGRMRPSKSITRFDLSTPPFSRTVISPTLFGPEPR